MKYRNFKLDAVKTIVFIVLILFCSHFSLRGQKYYEYPIKTELLHPFLDTNTNSEETKNLYVLGKINSPQVILEDKYGTLYAVMDTLQTPLFRLNYNNILDNPGCYILWEFGLFNLEDIMEYNIAKKIWPYKPFNTSYIRDDCEYSDYYKIVHLEKSPAAYVMVLIQGYFYNFINKAQNDIISDQLKKSEKRSKRLFPFCNQMAYYKTLVAVD